jgi:hypothetical protein
MCSRIALWLAFPAWAVAQDAPQIQPKFVPSPPVQPIPFSHRVHIATARLECKNCHPIPEPGAFATIPETAKCMSCHGTIKKDSPAVQKLAEFHNEGKPVPWRRVYRIPDYVDFSHKAHVAKGVTCENCHGQVRESDALRKEKETTMAACMDCHRAREASVACNYCHEQL